MTRIPLTEGVPFGISQQTFMPVSYPLFMVRRSPFGSMWRSLSVPLGMVAVRCLRS